MTRNVEFGLGWAMGGALRAFADSSDINHPKKNVLFAEA